MWAALEMEIELTGYREKIEVRVSMETLRRSYEAITFSPERRAADDMTSAAQWCDDNIPQLADADQAVGSHLAQEIPIVAAEVEGALELAADVREEPLKAGARVLGGAGKIVARLLMLHGKLPVAAGRALHERLIAAHESGELDRRAQHPAAYRAGHRRISS